jgi:hypothetical protein
MRINRQEVSSWGKNTAKKVQNLTGGLIGIAFADKKT